MPLCASIGPRTQSPTAQTPSTAGAAVLIDLDEAALVQLHAGAGSQQVLRIRPAADGHHQAIDADVLLALGIGVGDIDRIALDGGLRDLGAQADVQPLLLEGAQRLLGQLLVGEGQELGQRLEHDDLGAEAAPDAAELQTDDAGADDAEPLGHGIKVERAPGVDDLRGLEGHRAQLDRARTLRRARPAWRSSVRLAPSCATNSTLPGASSLPCPCSGVTPAPLKSARIPWVMLRTMPALRFCICARSSVVPATLMPWVANSSCTRWNSSLDSSSALEGMQPAFRHVPPKAAEPSRFFHSSIQATESLFCAARMAAG